MSRIVVDWDHVPLGTRTDKDLAAELGVSRELVRLARMARGVPRYIRKGYANTALLYSVLSAIGRSDGIPFREIYTTVINDYGSVTERTVHRVLNELIRRRRVRRQHPEGSAEFWGYSRVRS